MSPINFPHYFFAILLQILLSPVVRAAPNATLDAGVIIGTSTIVTPVVLGTPVTVNQFLGVPFAASPTRFAAPVTATPWLAPRNASSYGYACPQQFNYPAATRNATIAFFNTPPPPSGENEDCLTVNVFVPSTPGSGKVVMVWFYGGALTFGANSIPAYDGSSFAANQNIVIVTVNYRTNSAPPDLFGFPGPVSQLPFGQQNPGFLDQRLALDWVQRNIAAFGGDPKKVTIFGESAGAASVDELVTTYPMNPPFRAAILQSGQNSFYVNKNYTTPTQWNAVVAAVNCSSSQNVLACMRNVTRQTITNIIEQLALPFRPVNDNVTSLSNPEAARIAGNIARVPILLGTNANEGRIFVIGQNNTQAFLASTFGNNTNFTNTVLQAYPIGSTGISNAYEQIAAIYTDYIFQCQASIVANDSRIASFPTWRYFFNASFLNTQPLYPTLNLAAFHSSEIPLVFGTYTSGLNARIPATQFEARLSEYMQTAWATFARNPTGGPGWPAYPAIADLGVGAVPNGSAAGQLNVLVNASTIDARCSLWSAVYQSVGAGH